MSNVKCQIQILNLKSLRYFVAISTGKLANFIITKIFKRAGSTWPGEIALSLDKNFLKKTFIKNKLTTILIAGTNGKTTTASLIKFLLEKKNIRVFHNQEGANLLNGAVSSVIKYIKLNAKLDYQVAIFEVDENTLPLLVKELNPSSIILNNLFRDQLDRYGEVNTIALKWQESLKNLKNCQFFINADDPLLFYISKSFSAKVYYFGLDRELMLKKEVSHDVDSIYCPNCGEKLAYHKIAYSHLGDYSCPKCQFSSPKEIFSLKNPNTQLQGKYNLYNLNAASLLVSKIFSFPPAFIQNQLVDFRPVFGRQESFVYQGKKITIFLGKNPAGFNQAIEVVSQISQAKNLLLVLNDRIPDGRDVSWIWDVDLERLILYGKKIYVSGDRVYDMGLRLKYCLKNYQERKFFNFESLREAIETVVEQTRTDEEIFILATYSGMLEVRKILFKSSIPFF
ncbi:UDP-N-acetylmuramyl peptide synthase [Candidatus Roizmanbacteria bacterium CG22_combo_CG10-13_8_21_14_all_35_9]|uniref:Lipid II isoglutaminyl synthase (glutamine-hydrolyzing) subunit MurT n=3 Tax=Candidatus Roizmaniibacteriota TaxID=1752723 RepID=A0A2H0BZS7_9BACT|nr:MAG: UDP-N-acetylmuramyl peptide synthase [Candidatus Roizmanbacteria bacterium CG22_combo_CG10-13_8_21_14_all_35_9]PIY70728.1 MAG: DUF1727 domain-containing protein [Candidatus Roizmanbacteria bacterium CG_4_10_14_0_8_um_filter_35_28]